MSFLPAGFYWNSHYNYNNDDSNVCETNPVIWPLSWLTQFSLLGGELWFGVLSLDIHVALSNPFTSYDLNANTYTAVVYFLAITTATILVCLVPIKYGISTDPMIWIEDQRFATVNITKLLLFYVFMFLIYSYSLFVSIWARYQISKGLEDTLSMRQYSVRKQTICE